jgi:hypothetical protein
MLPREHVKESRMPRIAALLLMTTVALIAAGCAPYATFPPVEVDAASRMSRATFEPFPTLMAEAIRYTHDQYGDGAADFAWNLPRDTPHGVYTMVEKRLGAGRPMKETNERAFHVQTVRARGVEAEVDVIYPRSDGRHELVTIWFRNEILKGGWQVKRARPWYIEVEAPPAPTFVPPPGTGPDTRVVSGEGDR